MRHKNSTFEFEDERNADLLRAYREEIHHARHIDVTTIFQRIVNSPSRRFWVSEERATIVVSRLLAGDQLTNMRTQKREMYQEITRRVRKLMDDRPGDALQRIVADVIRQRAPRFYLTPGSAKIILYRIKRKCRTRGHTLR